MADFQHIDVIYPESENSDLDRISTNTVDIPAQEPVVVRGAGSTTL